MFGNNSPSLADIAAVTDNNRNNGAWGMDGMKPSLRSSL